MEDTECWLGKSKLLSEEFNVLLYFFDLLATKNINLSLFTESSALSKSWICETEPIIKPGCGGKLKLSTSGTTGTPKVKEYLFEDLVNKKIGKGSYEDSWLLTYHPARWAGMSVLLHWYKNKCHLIIPEDLSIFSILKAFPSATHVSLTPSLFRKLLLTDSNKLEQSKLKQITFGGEYTTQHTLNLAKSLWPEAKITHIYASTETGDICACSDGLEGYPEGKFSLSLEGEALINGISTGDYWKNEQGRLIFLGRKDELINVGGNKISPIQVEAATYSLEDKVKECKAYSIKNALLGQVVGLDYVGGIDPFDLKNYLRNQLPKYAVPMVVRQVSEIGLTAANKVSRQ